MMAEEKEIIRSNIYNTQDDHDDDDDDEDDKFFPDLCAKQQGGTYILCSKWSLTWQSWQ